MPQLSLVAMGTSLTASGGWLDALQKRLADRFDRDVAIAPVALNGANSDWGLSVAPRAAAERADIALVEFSINDASLTRGLSLKASTGNMKAIVAAIRAARADTRIFLMAMNPAFGPHGWIRPWLNAYYDRDRGLASALGAGFVDCRPAWRSLGRKELKRVIPDGLHPTPTAAARILPPLIVAAIADARS